MEKRNVNLSVLKNHYFILSLVVFIISVVGILYFELLNDFFIDDKERKLSIVAGEKIFYQNCANCHMNSPEAPSLYEIKSEYSSRELRKILSYHFRLGRLPETEYSGFNSDNERDDLINFLMVNN